MSRLFPKNDQQALFKFALPLITVGVILAAIGESRWEPLFWAGMVIILIGLFFAWLISPFA